MTELNPQGFALLAIWAVLFGLVGVRFVLKPLLGRKASQSDLRRIRVAFEGVVGAVGVNKRVAEIEHTGATRASRYKDAERIYRVTLVGSDGGTRRAKATVQVVLFGQGRITFENRYL